MRNLSGVFEPKSVAVIGASHDSNRIGGRPVKYYLENGFQGKVFPVNPNRSEIQGLKAFSCVDDLPQAPDLAVLALPANKTLQALTECIEIGTRSAVIFSSGFAETGGEGADWQRSLLELGNHHDCTFLGPNCLGVVNAHIGHTATFASFLQDGPIEAGPWAIISQSGAYGTYLQTWLSGLGIHAGLWMATGNESQVTIADGVHYAASHAKTDNILIFAESLRCGDELIKAIEAATVRGKRVAILKVGTTKPGQEAALSHTQALASDDQISKSLIEFSGARWLQSTTELVDYAYAIDQSAPVSSNRLGILTISGGAGVLMADVACKEGLEIPKVSKSVRDKILKDNPNASAINPVDVTAQAINEPELVRKGLLALAESGEVDSIAIFMMNWLESGSTKSEMLQMLQELSECPDIPPISIASLVSEKTRKWLEGLGYLVFSDPGRAVAGLSNAIKCLPKPIGQEPAELILDRPELESKHYDEREAKAWLSAIDIPTPVEQFCATTDEAIEMAGQLDCPCVLKIVSRDLAHKSDVGGVRLDIHGPEEMTAACNEMVSSIAQNAPDAIVSGFSVSAMEKPGVDLLVGVHDNACFGPVLTVGLGGVFTELFDDVAYARAPVSKVRAEALVRSLKGASLLDGVRGGQAVDLKAAASCISKLSNAAAARRDFDAIEINPLRVTSEGAVALDALIVSNDLGTNSGIVKAGDNRTGPVAVAELDSATDARSKQAEGSFG